MYVGSPALAPFPAADFALDFCRTLTYKHTYKQTYTSHMHTYKYTYISHMHTYRHTYKHTCISHTHACGAAPAYLQELCHSILGEHGRCALCSSTQNKLSILHARTDIRQHLAFSVVGPAVWNKLSVALHLMPTFHSDAFDSMLKTVIFS